MREFFLPSAEPSKKLARLALLFAIPLVSMVGFAPRASAATCTSISTADWNATTSPWDAACNGNTYPLAGDTIIIGTGTTITNPPATIDSPLLTVDGTLEVGQQAITLTGALDVSPGGVLHHANFNTFTVAGNVVVDGSVTGASAFYDLGMSGMSGNPVTLSGTGSIGVSLNILSAAVVNVGSPAPALTSNLDATGTIDLAGNILEVDGNIDGSGWITLSGGQLLLGGGICEGDCFTPNLTFDTVDTGTITYVGAAQTLAVRQKYDDLVLAGSDTKTLSYGGFSGGPYSLYTLGSLDIASGVTLHIDDHSVEGNGALTMASGSAITVADDGSLPKEFPSYPTYAIDPGSTVKYSASVDQLIEPAPSYGHVVVTTETYSYSFYAVSTTKTPDADGDLLTTGDGDLTVQTDLLLQDWNSGSATNTVVLDMNGSNLTVGDDIIVDLGSSLTFGGIGDSLNVGGSLFANGNITAPPAVASFNGTGLLDTTEEGSFSKFVIDTNNWTTLNIAGGDYQFTGTSLTPTQDLTVAAGASIDLGSAFATADNLIVDGTLSTTSMVRVVNTAPWTGSISGAGTINTLRLEILNDPMAGPLSVSGSPFVVGDMEFLSSSTLLNTGNFTVTGNAFGSGALDNDGILKIGSIDPTFLTLDASTIGNIVLYTGTSYSIVDVPYHHLSIGGTQGGIGGDGNLNVAGDLYINPSTTFSALGGTHSIGGALQFDSGAMFDGTGTLVFNGAGPQSIFSTTSNTLTFNNITLQSALAISSTVDATINGTLSLGTNILTVPGPTPLTLGVSSNATSAGGYIDGPVKQLLGVGVPKTIYVGQAGASAPLQITVTAGTSPAMQVTPFGTQHAGAPAGSLAFYWQLDPTGVTTADLVFNYDESDVVGTEALYKLARWDGTQWVVVEGSTVDTTSNTASASNIGQFSPWTLIQQASCTVTNTLDDGAGSLRQAIRDANAGGCTTIDFNIAGTGPHTISLGSSLPAITATGIMIDGFTQPGAAANTATLDQPVNASWQIIIDGPACQLLPCGLSAISTSADTTIRGLAIQNTGIGIRLQGAGAFVSGNRLSGHIDAGVNISGSSNQVGGADADRNVFAGSQHGVWIIQSGASNNVVDGNHIGFDQSGAAAGTGSYGVVIDFAGTGNTIGTSGRGNVIGNSNGAAGVAVFGDGIAASNNGFIEGNRIGTNLQGTAAAPNTDGFFGAGVYLDTTDGYTISGNLLSGHQSPSARIDFSPGIYLFQSGNNTIYSNLIGTDIAGTGSIPNAYGIIFDSSSNNVVGAGLGQNTIMNNLADGIAAYGGLANKWYDNVVMANGAIAIDLDDDGADTNDIGDGDTGANNKQNHPTVTSATVSSTTLDVTVSLDSSTPNPAAIRVEIVETDLNGEINTPIGSQCITGSVLTDALVSLPPGTVIAGDLVAALATSYSDTGCTTALDGSSEVGASFAVNGAPVANPDSATTNEDTAVTIAVLVNDTDDDTISIVSWTQGANGTVSCTASDCTYTPALNFNGFDSFTYTIADSFGVTSTATVSVTVNPVNDAPVAVDDFYSTSEDTEITIAAPGVLDNDTDVDGDPLTAVLVTTTANGTLTLNSDGSFTYTPNANFNGSDSFTYQAFDGSASSNTATVTLTVNAVNDPPVANPDFASTPFETPVVIDVVANDTDVDGDTLTVSGNTQPSNGSASCSGTSCTYTPAAGFTGTDSFIYTVSDGNGGTDTATVTITVSAATDADLMITKTGPATATRGTPIDFTIMVKNNGPGSALNVVVNDTSDPGLEFQSNSGDCTTAFPCNLGTLASGETRVITSTFGVIGAGSLSNTASVSSSTADPNTANNSSTAVVNACPNAPTGLQPSGLNGIPQSGTLSWNGSADRFVVFLGPIGSGCNTRLGETTANSISYSGLDPNTEYEWRVVAISGGCVEASSACVRFTTEGCGTEAPELVSPNDNSAPTTPVMFQWSAVGGATGYVVHAGVEGDPMTEVARTSQNETSASVAIGPGRVQWRVEALYGPNCPPVSSRTGTFTAVLAGECREEKPQNVSPAPGASSLSSPLSFSWIGVDGATGYRVWVAIEDEFPVVVATTSGATSATAEVPSGQLFWYVQALFDGCPPTISDPTRFSIAPGSNCPTVAAQLIAPQNGATVAGEVTFEWTDVSGSVRYAVWASVDGDAPAIVGTTNESMLTRRMDFGKIEWFVQTFFGGCPAIFSERNTFDSVEDFVCPTGVAQPLSPNDGASFSNALVPFSWTPVDGADGYRVLGRFGGVGEFEVIGSSLAGTELQIPVEATFLEWKVQTVFIGCPSTESISRSLEINQISCSTQVSELLLPAVQSTLPDERVLMSWTLVDGAVAYEVWVASIDGVPSKVALTDGLTTDVEVDLDEGEYQWWVNAILGGECDKTRSGNASFSVDFLTPDNCDSESELVLISPSEGAAQLVSPIILEWTAVPGATSYRIFTISPNGVATPFGPVRESNQTVVQFQPGIVRWYVVANRAGCSPLRSPIQHFRVESGAECDVPDRPSLRVPQKVASNTEYRVAWDQVPGATVYEIQEAPVPVFAGVPVQVVNGTTASFIHTVEAGRRSFYYRVRAIGDCNGERGNYSTVARVFVDASSVSETDALSRRGLTTMAEDVPGGAATVELNKDSLSRREIEQFTVRLTGEGTFQVVPDQPWLTVEPEIVTLTPAGVQVTVFAQMADLPLGSNQASLDLIPVAGKGGVTTSQTGGTVGVSVSMVTPVSSKPKNEPLPESLIIPAVAHTTGANGSTWLSDVRLSNVGSTAQKYQLNFTPSSTDGTREGQSTTIDVKPGSSVALNDLLANWFGAVEENASGLLEIRPLKATTSSSIGGLAAVASGGPASLASSRTYNFTPEGTFGHYVPAIRFDQFVGTTVPEGETKPVLSMQQIAQSSAFRTNLGLVEASGKATTAQVTIFSAAGAQLGQFLVPMQAGSHVQLNAVLAQNNIFVENGRIEVEAVEGDGKLMAYAAVVDNRTNDPQLVQAVSKNDASGRRWVIPGVADIDTGAASWRTDTRIYNAGNQSVEATLTFYPQAAPGSPITRSVMINSGEVFVADNILQSLFGVKTDGGAVHVETAQNAQLIATARTYDLRSDGGTVGQFIPAQAADRGTAVGERALQILQVEQSERFRANIGLAETTGNPVVVEVSAIVPGAKAAPRIRVNLQGNQFTQLLKVLETLGVPNSYNSRVAIKVVGGSGRVVAYGSIIDNITQDPTYVPAQ